MIVHVKARPPLARRCRCGYCFDAEGQELEVTERELAALKADPMLVVTEAGAPWPPKPTANPKLPRTPLRGARPRKMRPRKASPMPDALPPVAVLRESPPYGSVATLLEHFGRDELMQLAPARADADDPEREELDEALLLRALRRASREADSYLATRYKVPLTPATGEDGAAIWPEPLTGFVADMAH